MSDVKNIVYNLLNELDHICKENDITYSLSGKTLLGAMQGGDLMDTIPYGEIMIFAEDTDRFIKAVEENIPEDRILDYFGKNTSYPDISLRYSDTNSLCLSLFSYADYLSKGIYVKITLIKNRSNNEKLFKRMHALERSMNVLLTKGKKEKFKRKVGAFLFLVNSYFLSKKRCRALFNSWIEFYSKPGNEHVIFEGIDAIDPFETGLFDETGEIALGDRTYSCINNSEQYISSVFSPDWEKHPKMRLTNEYPLVMATAEFGYDHFIKNVISEQILIEHFKIAKAGSVPRKDKKSSWANKNISDAWKIGGFIAEIEKVKYIMDSDADISAPEMEKLSIEYYNGKHAIRRLDLNIPDMEKIEAFLNEDPELEEAQ